MKDGISFIEGNNSKNILNSSIYIYIYMGFPFQRDSVWPALLFSDAIDPASQKSNAFWPIEIEQSNLPVPKH